jgi:superfamily II DNA or RNA helicase
MLRPYQCEGVEKFLSTGHPERQVFSWPPGSGKTGAAITAARELGAKTIIVVAPAMVRPAWGREFAKWWEGQDVGLIVNSRKAINLTKAQKEYNAWAYSRPVQIVSYNLLKELTAPVDMLIIDEAHRLRNPISAQTKRLRDRSLAFPETKILELTGTLVPNEARQLWAPINVLQPGVLGASQKNGKENYAWMQRHCFLKKTEWGGDHYGFKKETRDALLAKIAHLVHEVDESVVAPYLPPLFVEPLFVDLPGALTELVDDWREDLECTHYGVFCHLNETAEALAAHFPNCTYIDARRHDAATRDRMLQASKAKPTDIIISTTHALQEGISLSFLKQALVVEWQSAIDQLVQFIGRFARPDAATTYPTYVRFVVRPEDAEKAARISRRIDEKNALLKAGRAEGLALGAFAERTYTDEDFDRLAEAAFASYNPLKDEYDDGQEEE